MTCPHFWTLLRAQNTTLLSKVRRRFFQILWPSQKTQTLIYNLMQGKKTHNNLAE